MKKVCQSIFQILLCTNCFVLSVICFLACFNRLGIQQRLSKPTNWRSQAFPRWLETKLVTENGSQIVLSADVKEILVENGIFKGVKYIKRHKEYEVHASHLIAACDVENCIHSCCQIMSSRISSKRKWTVQNCTAVL